MKSWAIKILPPIIFFLLFLIFFYLSKEASPNRGDAKLKELQQIAAEVPVFPALKEVSTNYSSRFSDAGVYKYYSSTATYVEVKRFYSTILIQQGYILACEENLQRWFNDDCGRKLIFQKGDFRISIEYAGNSVTSGSWNYAINFLWH